MRKYILPILVSLSFVLVSCHSVQKVEASSSRVSIHSSSGQPSQIEVHVESSSSTTGTTADGTSVLPVRADNLPSASSTSDDVLEFAE